MKSFTLRLVSLTMSLKAGFILNLLKRLNIFFPFLLFKMRDFLASLAQLE